jgi:YgiT-type zinc finger domain-containing protein
MKCVVCKKGEIRQALTTITLEKNGTTIIFSKVPCLTCDKCGEVYLDEDVSDKMDARLETAASIATEINTQEFDANCGRSL